MSLEKLLNTAAVLSERQNVEWEDCPKNRLAIARKRVILMRMVARGMLAALAKLSELHHEMKIADKEATEFTKKTGYTFDDIFEVHRITNNQ